MTKNQIEYAKLLETRRANLRQEELTSKRDATTRELGIGTLGETSRHNQAVELLDSAKAAETKRSNVAKEAETRRSNLAKESETQRSNMERERETARSNVARETETQRHQKAAEAISIGQTAASTAAAAAELAERVRSNMARESETALHNRAMELKDIKPELHVTTPATTVSTPVQIAVDARSNNKNQTSISGSSTGGMESWKETGATRYGWDSALGAGAYIDRQEISSTGRTRVHRRYANGKESYFEE